MYLLLYVQLHAHTNVIKSLCSALLPECADYFTAVPSSSPAASGSHQDVLKELPLQVEH